MAPVQRDSTSPPLEKSAAVQADEYIVGLLPDPPPRAPPAEGGGLIGSSTPLTSQSTTNRQTASDPEPAAQGSGCSSPVGSDVSRDFNLNRKNPKREAIAPSDNLDIELLMAAIDLEDYSIVADVVKAENAASQAAGAASNAGSSVYSDPPSEEQIRSARSSIAEDLLTIVCPGRLNVEATGEPKPKPCVWNSQPKEKKDEESNPAVLTCQYCLARIKFRKPTDPSVSKETQDLFSQWAQSPASPTGPGGPAGGVQNRYRRNKDGKESLLYAVVYTKEEWESQRRASRKSSRTNLKRQR